MGNVDGQEGVDILDLTMMLNYLYSTGVTIECMDAANVDGSTDGQVDMGDLIAMADYLFREGELAECR